MADTITTSLGLDASAALDALARMDAASAKLDATLTNLASTMSRIGTVSSGIESMGKSATESLNSATGGVQSFTLSWTSMERIVVGRAISQGMFAFKEAIIGTIGSAIQLNTEVSRLATLSGEAPGNLLQQIRYFSDNAAVSLQDAVQGMGAAFKANVGDITATNQLLREAQNLSKATGATPAGAVTAVGEVIKGFNLSVNDARTVSDKLLTVVQHTHAGLEDLSGSFGRIAPLAVHLGTSFDETAAGVVSLTNAGMSTGQALSLMERTMRGLLSPSKDLKEEMAGLGYSSGSAMVAALGLEGTLTTLASKTSGSSEELLKIVKAGRSASAEFSLGTITAESYAKSLSQIEGTQAGAAASAAADIMDTSAGRIQASAQRIKNAFTVDLGERLLGSLDTLSGGGEKVISGFRGAIEMGVTAIPLISGSLFAARAGWGKLGDAAEKANARADAAVEKASKTIQKSRIDVHEWEKTMGEEGTSTKGNYLTKNYGQMLRQQEQIREMAADESFNLRQLASEADKTALKYERLTKGIQLAGLAAMAIGGGVLIGQELNAQLDRTNEAIKEMEAKKMSDVRANSQQRIDMDAQAAAKQVADALKASESVSRIYMQESEIAKESAQATVRIVDDKLKQMIESHKSYLNQITSAEKTSQSEIEAGIVRIENLRERAADRQNKSQLDYLDSIESSINPESKLAAMEEHRDEIARRAEERMRAGAQTGNKAEIEKGRKELDDALKANEEIEKAYKDRYAAEHKGESPEDLKWGMLHDRKVQGATDEGDALLQRQISMEQEITRLEQQRVKNLQAEREHQEGIVQQIEKQAAIAQRNSQLLDANGNLKPKAALDQMESRRNAALSELERLKFGAGDAAKAKSLGISKDYLGDLSKEPRELKLSVTRSLEAIPHQIDAVFNRYKASLKIDVDSLSGSSTEFVGEKWTSWGFAPDPRILEALQDK